MCIYIYIYLLIIYIYTYITKHDFCIHQLVRVYINTPLEPQKKRWDKQVPSHPLGTSDRASRNAMEIDGITH